MSARVSHGEPRDTSQRRSRTVVSGGKGPNEGKSGTPHRDADLDDDEHNTVDTAEPLSSSITSYDLHTIADAELIERGLVSHHLDSYNALMPGGLEQFLSEICVIEGSLNKAELNPQSDDGISTIEYSVHFQKVTIDSPVFRDYANGQHTHPMMPNTARRLDRNYCGAVRVSVAVMIKAHKLDGSAPLVKEVPPYDLLLGELPIMVGSRKCYTYRQAPEARLAAGEDPYDSGGYFIIQGMEWGVDAVESRVYNHPNVFYNLGHRKEVARLEIISKPGDAFENSSEMIMTYLLGGQIVVALTSVRYFKDVLFPFHLLFRMYERSDQEIFDNILYAPRRTDSNTEQMFQTLKRAMACKYEGFEDAEGFVGLELQHYVASQIARRIKYKKMQAKSREQQIEETTNYLMRHLQDLLNRYFLPHIGLTTGDTLKKLRYFGHLVHKLLLVEMRVVESTDRDSLKNKRFHAAGQALAKQLKQLINHDVVKPISDELPRLLINVPFAHVDPKAAFKPLASRKLERDLIKEIITSTRAKRADEGGGAHHLRTQPLHRKNQLNTLSALRTVRAAIVSAARKDERARLMRNVPPSYVKSICPLQTADTGEDVGVVKQLALLCHISQASNSYMLKTALLKDPDIIELSRMKPAEIGLKQVTVIKVNGDQIGFCRHAYQIVRRYREVRRGYISKGLRGAVAPTNQPIASKSPTYHATPVDKHSKVLTNRLAVLQEETFTVATSEQRTGLPILRDATIAWDTDSNEISFWVDQGRPLNPLLVVRNNGPLDPIGQELIGHNFDYTTALEDLKPGVNDFQQRVVLTRKHLRQLKQRKVQLSDLVEQGILDYVAPEEMEGLQIAPSPEDLTRREHDPLNQYTHCEIPVGLVGLPALTCPYSVHNQAPRITFQTNQVKQTCGCPTLNYGLRCDKQSFVSFATEMPLITTLANNYVYPNGQNTIVAISTTDLGNNQEDSVAANETSSQRGLHAGKYYNVLSKVLDREQFATPTSAQKKHRHANYAYLDKGRIPLGTQIKQNDVVIGAVADAPKGRQTKGAGPAMGAGGTGPNGVATGEINTSVVYTYHEDARVEDVIGGGQGPLEARNHEDKPFCKVKVGSVRTFGVGQKFSSRHGQKGMTGSEANQMDTYFSEDGLSPDLIVSPHAIPSRMTIGQLIESLDSTAAAMLGHLRDASIFTPTDLKAVGDELIRHGWSRYGSRPMYSGRTGDFLEAELFIGPTYYQRLQKFIEDEIYDAASSTIDPLTHQPREGKKVGGGLRMGEMEKDVLMGNGLSSFLMEKFRDNSDGFDIHVCRLCGTMPIVNVARGQITCTRCSKLGQTPDVFRVPCTWCTKLWVQELESAGVGVQFEVNPYRHEQAGPSPFFSGATRI